VVPHKLFTNGYDNSEVNHLAGIEIAIPKFHPITPLSYSKLTPETDDFVTSFHTLE
jgi:hypothetical protein